MPFGNHAWILLDGLHKLPEGRLLHSPVHVHVANGGAKVVGLGEEGFAKSLFGLTSVEEIRKNITNFQLKVTQIHNLMVDISYWSSKSLSLYFATIGLA